MIELHLSWDELMATPDDVIEAIIDVLHERAQEADRQEKLPAQRKAVGLE